MTLDELVIEVAGEPHLLGSRCLDCGVVTFPRQGSCPRCTGQNVEERRLARRGTLWSWTVQAFCPKEPFVGAGLPFEPYGVGYVDLGGEVLVEGRLVNIDRDQLAIGAAMEVVLETLGHDVITYAFAHAESA